MPIANGVSVLDKLRIACASLGIAPGWDETVSEAEAAILLQRSPLTIRNRRLQDEPIPFNRRGGRVRYRLEAIAAFLASENTHD